MTVTVNPLIKTADDTRTPVPAVQYLKDSQVGFHALLFVGFGGMTVRIRRLVRMVARAVCMIHRLEVIRYRHDVFAICNSVQAVSDTVFRPRTHGEGFRMVEGILTTLGLLLDYSQTEIV